MHDERRTGTLSPRLVIETLSFRLEEDSQLHFLPDVRSDLEELLATFEDECL